MRIKNVDAKEIIAHFAYIANERSFNIFFQEDSLMPAGEVYLKKGRIIKNKSLLDEERLNMLRLFWPFIFNDKDDKIEKKDLRISYYDRVFIGDYHLAERIIIDYGSETIDIKVKYADKSSFKN